MLQAGEGAVSLPELGCHGSSGLLYLLSFIIIVDFSSAWTARSKGRSESRRWTTSTPMALR